MNFDLAIIGGGPAGYNAAEKAAKGGLKTILFEKNEIGGVCLNEGCIPTKTLLCSAKYFDHAKEAKKYGIKIDGDINFDYKRIIARKNKVVRKLTAGIRAKLTNAGVEMVNSNAFIKKEENDLFTITTDSDNEFLAKNILLCTGSETFIPPIKGVEKIEYWTSKEALESKECPDSIVIIGGGVIGMEFASFFNSMGTEVNVVEMLPEILGPMDDESSIMLREYYTKRGVKFYLNTKVIELLENGVKVEKDGEVSVVEAQKILLSVGRRANFKNLGLETLNIETLRNGVKVNEFMQTSHPRIYAAGDITGYSLLAHTAIREGEVAINHILGKDDKMSYRAIPSVVYTNPEISGVGKTEEQLKEENINYKVIKLPLAFSGRFVAENEGINGLFKLIVDENNKIIGAHMLGNPSSEIIFGLGMAIDNNETLETLSKHVYPHPTVAEIIHESLD